MAAIKAAAPSFGVSAAPAKTINAPSGPPIQFHHGAERIAFNEGGEGLKKA